MCNLCHCVTRRRRPDCGQPFCCCVCWGYLACFFRRTTISLTNLMCVVDLKSPSTLELPALRSGGSRKDSFSRMTTARDTVHTRTHPRYTISGKQQNKNRKRRLKDRCSSSICRWPWSMRQQQQQQLVSFGHWPLIVFTKQPQQHRLTFPSIRSAFLPSLKANHQRRSHTLGLLSVLLLRLFTYLLATRPQES